MRRCTLAFTAALALWIPARLSAHDIPVSVVVHAFVRPQGERLRLLVRAPLGAMRDVEFPVRGDGLLDLPRADQSLRDAAMLWLARDVVVYEGNRPLGEPTLAAVRVSLPSDRSFVTFESALASVTGPPLPPDTTLYGNQALLDVLFEYPIQSDRSTFSIRPSLGRLGGRVVTVVRYQPPAGAERVFELTGDPGLVRMDPSWFQAAWRFVQLGFLHILDGTDHLLFLACLVIPFRRFRSLVLIVTAFTIAHSITLLASAFNLAPGGLWFPPLVETLIAMSILYMALENIVGVMSVQRRWVLAFAFGLVHGFGFSFALRETLQFAGSHLVTSLLAFNVGVELGQLLVLAALVPALQVLFRYVVAERIGTIILSAFVAHTAWHWTTERWGVLREFPWPSPTVSDMSAAIRWLMALVGLAAVIWGVAAIARRKNQGPAVN
ncbi:MAG TPA: HupE/UreJ family protein [Candidatus Polarisedimenticolia bacterium]|nr:HupE/UreJ family protein [Candidatus Polarisedimenticolia bacterium]